MLIFRYKRSRADTFVALMNNYKGNLFMKTRFFQIVLAGASALSICPMTFAQVAGGAGGFIGIGRHDVAVPVTQIQDQAGKLVMAGATKDTIKSMPAFTYAIDTTKRDEFVAAADADIVKGKAKVAELEKKAGAATKEAKAKMDLEIAALKADLKSTESKLDKLKRATAARWQEFEAGVSDATARLRKSIDATNG